MSSRTRHLLSAAVIVAAAYAAAFAHLMRFRDDISWFVVAGSAGIDQKAIPPGLSIIPGVEGYDGVTFYRLALDPFTRERTAYGITLDGAPYRQQRIVYPLIVHVLSLGRAEWVPTLLVAVNFVAAIALAIGAGLVCSLFGVSPLWGTLVPLYPGLFIAFSRSTAEIVAWAFAIWAVWAFAASRPLVAATLLSVAVLTRETTLVVPLAIGAAGAWRWVRRRESIRGAAIAFLVPFFSYVAWQLVLRSWWGLSGLEAGAIDATAPFSGYWRVLSTSFIRRTSLQRVHVAECVFLALFVVAVIVSMAVANRSPLEWRLAFAGTVVLASVLGADVWSESPAFMRVLSDVHATGAIILFGGRAAPRWIILAATCTLSLYVVSHLR